MSYQTEFTGWDSLAIGDLLVAYRKAKADCFFENTFPTAIKFAEYEQDLLANLNDLLSLLKSNSGFEGDELLLGEFRLLPKKLSTDRKPDSSENGHVHFSKPERAVESLVILFSRKTSLNSKSVHNYHTRTIVKIKFQIVTWINNIHIAFCSTPYNYCDKQCC